ncbi:MAG: cysteine hydrolase family protein [Brevinema sp.]
MNPIVSVKAEPYSFDFDVKHTALVIIDMQRDFCVEGGFGEKLGNNVSATKNIIPTVKRFLEFARSKGMFVIHIREGHRPDLSDLFPNKLACGKKGGAGIGDQGPMGRILIRGEKGHDIVEELYPITGEPVINKPGKGAFYATDLETILHTRGITHIFFAGVTTYVCVQTSIREANDRGFKCALLKDCSAAFDVRDHEDSCRMISQQGGIFGWVTSSEEVIKAFEGVK